MPEPIGIGHAALDRPVHAGQQIDDLEVAPVGVDRLLVLRAAPRAAAIVHLQHGEAVGGEDLADVVEAVVVLPVGAAVNPEHQRQLSCRRAGWPGQQAVDDGAVLGGEGDVLDARKRDLGHPRVVVRGDLPQGAAFDHVHLVGRAGRRRQQRHGALGAQRHRPDDAAARRERLDRAAGRGNAREVLDAIVFDREVQALAIRRPFRRADRSDRATR